MKGFGNIMKQAQKVQEEMAKVQEKAGDMKVSASAGGGMVTVEANGRQEIISISVDPEVINPDDLEMLQDLILAAVNEALRKSRDMLQEEMAKITGGLNIPGLGV
jgi:nucleoid-associated protein EbfC